MIQPTLTIYVPNHCPTSTVEVILSQICAQSLKSIQILISGYRDAHTTKRFQDILSANNYELTALDFFGENRAGAFLDLNSAINNSKGKYFLIVDDAVSLLDNEFIDKTISLLECNPMSVLCHASHVQANSIDSDAPARILKLLGREYWCELYGLIRTDAIRQVDGCFENPLIILVQMATLGPFISIGSKNQVTKKGVFAFDLQKETISYSKFNIADFLKDSYATYAAFFSSFERHEYYERKGIFIDVIFRNPKFREVIRDHYGLTKNSTDDTYTCFLVDGVISSDSEVFHCEGNSLQNFTVQGLSAGLEVRNQKVLNEFSPSSSQRKAIVSAHFRPSPPKDGAENRALQTLKAIKSIGFEVVFFSVVSDQWSYSVISHIENALGVKVVLFAGGVKEYKHVSMFHKPHQPAWFYATPGTRRYFHEVYSRVKPSLTWVNYASLSKLVIGQEYRFSTNVIDTIDLLSLNSKMASHVWRHLGKIKAPFNADEVDPILLDENFYHDLGLEPDDKEFDVYDSFDHCVAISKREADILGARLKHSKVHYLPFTFDARNIDNSYSQNPVFAIGPNQFNFQGYLYFVKRVLPLIRQRNPDFKLQVIGTGCSYLAGAEGIELSGFIPDIESVYAKSKFAICPLIGATGQQLKVLEAMSFGLPVIALKNVAERCPIYHGINGLVANNAEEFAEYTLQLFNDADMCSRLGKAARQTIIDEYNNEVLKDKLEFIVTGTREKSFFVPPVYYIRAKHIWIDLKTEFYFFRHHTVRKNKNVKFALKVLRKAKSLI